MADTKLKVTFTDIEVIRDGDPMDKGELYWSLKVDGSVVTSRSVATPTKPAAAGLSPSAKTPTSPSRGGSVQTSLSAARSPSKDSGLNGKDESASFSHNYNLGNDWGTGNPHTVPLNDRNLDVVINYIVERV